VRWRRLRLRVVALAGLAALPVVGDGLRRGAGNCAMDGVAIATPSCVRVVDADGSLRLFCCVRCADRWVGLNGAPRSILVIDGPTGGQIDAGSAWFVRSPATWGDGAPDGIRAFARRSDAERHVRAYGGRMLEGAARPFAGVEEEMHGALGE